MNLPLYGQTSLNRSLTMSLQVSSNFLKRNDSPMGPTDFDPNANKTKIYKFIVGEDTHFPKVMSNDEANKWLNDPFAELILKKNLFPLTTNDLIKEFEKTQNTPHGLKKYSVFHIAEGGQIPQNAQTDKIDRTFRLVLALETDQGIKKDVEADVLISTGTLIDSKEQFLQLMSWDTKHCAFNFYQRLNDIWVWSGNSFHSLESNTRAKGPFLGHINGGPVMKELKLPWQNWRSMDAQISPNIFPPDDPFVNHRFFKDPNLVKGGEIFEKIVEAAFGIWNDCRINQGMIENKVKNFHFFLRQVLEATNVNLISSAKSFDSIDEDSTIILPFSFFANTEALNIVGLNTILPPVKVSGKLYLENLKKFDFALKSDGVKLPGDTHFAFFVPEPAAEDNDLLRKIISKEMLSERLAACLLMVDFSNPIFSIRRAKLSQYIPEEIIVGNKGQALDNNFVKNVITSNQVNIKGSPESEFMQNWNTPNWKEEFPKKLQNYFNFLTDKVQSQEGYDEIVKLAESRRNLFKQTKLYEFPLTFASTNIDSSIRLEITPEAKVQAIN